METNRPPRFGELSEPLRMLASRADARADLGDEHERLALYRWAFDHDDAWARLLEATRAEQDDTVATSVVFEMLTRVPSEAAETWIAASPSTARSLVARRADDIEILRDHQVGSRVRRSAPAAEWSDWLQRRVAATSPDTEVLEQLHSEGRTRRVRSAAGQRLKHRITATRFDGAAEPITEGMPTCGLYQVRMPDGVTVQLHDMDLVAIELTDATGGSLRVAFRWSEGWTPAEPGDTPFFVATATNVVIQSWIAEPDPSGFDDVRNFDWNGARILTLETTQRHLMFYADAVRLTMADRWKAAGATEAGS